MGREELHDWRCAKSINNSGDGYSPSLYDSLPTYEFTYEHVDPVFICVCAVFMCACSSAVLPVRFGWGTPSTPPVRAPPLGRNSVHELRSKWLHWLFSEDLSFPVRLLLCGLKRKNWVLLDLGRSSTAAPDAGFLELSFFFRGS